jgi:hypothetical protein
MRTEPCRWTVQWASRSSDVDKQNPTVIVSNQTNLGAVRRSRRLLFSFKSSSSSRRQSSVTSAAAAAAAAALRHPRAVAASGAVEQLEAKQHLIDNTVIE